MRLRLPLVIAAAILAFLGLYTVSQAGESEDPARAPAAPAPLQEQTEPGRQPISLGSPPPPLELPASTPATAAPPATAPVPAPTPNPAPVARAEPTPAPAPAPAPEPEPEREAPPSSGGRPFSDVE